MFIFRLAQMISYQISGLLDGKDVQTFIRKRTVEKWQYVNPPSGCGFGILFPKDICVSVF